MRLHTAGVSLTSAMGVRGVLLSTGRCPMYVYAIQARQYVKIGKANDPGTRLNDLQVGNCFP